MQNKILTVNSTQEQMLRTSKFTLSLQWNDTNNKKPSRKIVAYKRMTMEDTSASQLHTVDLHNLIHNSFYILIDKSK